jgi:hypothetical protein
VWRLELDPTFIQVIIKRYHVNFYSMAIWKMGKVQKKQKTNPKRWLAKWWNFEEKKEKMKLLQVQNKKDVKDLKKQKRKMWRPALIDDSVLKELKTCFAVWMTDEEACYFCQISWKTLYNYQNKHPEFVQEKSILKKSINLQAKMNIAKSVKLWDTENSKWWLTKKDPEFKPQQWEILVWIDNWDNKIIVKVRLPEI